MSPVVGRTGETVVADVSGPDGLEPVVTVEVPWVGREVGVTLNVNVSVDDGVDEVGDSVVNGADVEGIVKSLLDVEFE